MNEAGKVSNFPWLRQRVYNPVVNFDRCEQLVPNKRLQLVAAYFGCRFSRPHPTCITFNDQWFASVLHLYFNHDHHDHHHIFINIIITIIADQCTRIGFAGECYFAPNKKYFFTPLKKYFFISLKKHFFTPSKKNFFILLKKYFFTLLKKFFFTSLKKYF